MLRAFGLLAIALPFRLAAEYQWWQYGHTGDAALRESAFHYAAAWGVLSVAGIVLLWWDYFHGGETEDWFD